MAGRRSGDAWRFSMCALLLGACAGSVSQAPAGPIRVATTGDVPPFSEFVSGTYVGIDIDLARDFSASVGRPVTFIRTTWGRLTADLVERRFDLAMSGIDITAERESVGWFSAPYLERGKQTVVRCADIARFVRLEDANRLGVRVVTVANTTSDAFAQAHLPAASIAHVPDPESLYRRLQDGTADLLIVDAIEAHARVSRETGLCIGMGGALLSHERVAILMPRGSPLRAAINEWIGTRLSDGSVMRIFGAHAARTSGL